MKKITIVLVIFFSCIAGITIANIAKAQNASDDIQQEIIRDEAQQQALANKVANEIAQLNQLQQSGEAIVPLGNGVTP